MSKEQVEALAAEVTRLADEYAIQRQRTNIFDDAVHEIRRDLHEAIDALAALASPAAEPVKHWCKNCMGVDPASCALNNAPAAEPVQATNEKQSALNDWFLSLPAGRQAVLNEHKWMLADAAFEAGRALASTPATKEAKAPFGAALAMAVLQSDLYQRLDDKQHAECDELIQRHLDWMRADSAAAPEGAALAPPATKEAKAGWIPVSERKPKQGQLIVKRWRGSGSVWAGPYFDSPKQSSFDEWTPLPAPEGAA